VVQFVRQALLAKVGISEWHIDGLERGAAVVFVTHCISINFIPNGRKVMALIL